MTDHDNITTDIAEQAAERLTERLDTDLRGAYRAGYDYLYVGHPYPTTPSVDPDDLTIRVVTLPTDADLNHWALPDEYRWARYELDIPTEVFRAAVERAREGTV